MVALHYFIICVKNSNLDDNLKKKKQLFYFFASKLIKLHNIFRPFEACRNHAYWQSWNMASFH